MNIICIKTKLGIDLPVDTQILIDDQHYSVMGLAREEEKDGLICQWWIVSNET